MAEKNPEAEGQKPKASSRRDIWLTIVSWGVTGLLVIGMVAVALLNPFNISAATTETPTQIPTSTKAKTQDTQAGVPTPVSSDSGSLYVVRAANPHTIIPNRPRAEVIQYTVAEGDSVFGMAKKFGIKPETLLWANEKTLNDNPDMVSPGITLDIPPVDGIYYQWKKGDTIESVAKEYKATPEDILDYAGNKIDLSNPVIPEGTYIMVRNGQREFKQWVIPTIPRGASGVVSSIYGVGACDTSAGGAGGSGSFSWPAANHYLSGNDYWSGHLGIDIAAGEGMGVFAADSGLVVYAGWSDGGYGNMVMIDHNDGYQTVYAHLETYYVSCGQSVGKGQAIGAAGTTGNSTGPHLHFEVRYMGGFVSPWTVLP